MNCKKLNFVSKYTVFLNTFGMHIRLEKHNFHEDPDVGQWKNCVKLTTVRSFLTSSTARSILSLALFSQSSTVMSTCSSSFRCSQLGLPRFCSSCHTERQFTGVRENPRIIIGSNENPGKNHKQRKYGINHQQRKSAKHHKQRRQEKC